MVRWTAPVALLMLAMMPAEVRSETLSPPLSHPLDGAPDPVLSSRAFAMPHPDAGPSARRDHGSRILAGTELMPNGMVGLGLFGFREAKEPMKPVTGREMALPRARKMSIGFSLRF